MNNLVGSNQCDPATFRSQSTLMERGKQIQQEDTRVVNPMRNILQNVAPFPDQRREHDLSMGRDQQRELNLNVCIPLYVACIKGDWKSAEPLIEESPEILNEPINLLLQTALHTAVTWGHLKLVEDLLFFGADLTRQDIDGKTAFAIAAESGNIDIAHIIFVHNKNLPMIRANDGGLPIELASRFGHYKMVSYLFDKTEFSTLSELDRGHLFLVFIASQMYDFSLKMMETNKELATFQDDSRATALSYIACNPSAISNRRQLKWFQRLLRCIFRDIFHKAQLKILARQLVEQVWASVQQQTEQQFWDYLNAPTEIVFNAASNGNIEFLRILLSSYPSLLCTVNENNHTIYHIAALRRQEAVFSTIYEIGAMKDIVAIQLDVSGNCMLHLVAYMPSNEDLNHVSGAALQLQQEITWYKAVEEVVPPCYHTLKNKANDTPHDIFVREHKTLRDEGEKWMKDTASSCMIVAALMTTVVFAAAFTVPGGYSDEPASGFPNFESKAWFAVFILSDSVGHISFNHDIEV